jgi:hypothetical protein
LTARGKILDEPGRSKIEVRGEIVDTAGKLLVRCRGEFVMLAENQLSSVPQGLKQKMTSMFEQFE